MPISGSNIKGENFRLRFFVLVFMGIAAVSSVLYWRTKLLGASEYIDLPNHKNDLERYEQNKLQSKNFQLEVQDSSPAVQ